MASLCSTISGISTEDLKDEDWICLKGHSITCLVAGGQPKHSHVASPCGQPSGSPMNLYDSASEVMQPHFCYIQLARALTKVHLGSEGEDRPHLMMTHVNITL